METWTNSEVLFEGRIFRLRTGNVQLADGSPAYREVVEHPGGLLVGFRPAEWEAALC